MSPLVIIDRCDEKRHNIVFKLIKCVSFKVDFQPCSVEIEQKDFKVDKFHIEIFAYYEVTSTIFIEASIVREHSVCNFYDTLKLFHVLNFAHI